jgi:hypothetical protein
MKVEWLHDFANDPILYFCELDTGRYETRKIEIYRDGSFGMATKEMEFGGAGLGETPTPSLEEISKDPQFIPEKITAAEFEEVWSKYINFLC